MNNNQIHQGPHDLEINGNVALEIDPSNTKKPTSSPLPTTDVTDTSQTDNNSESDSEEETEPPLHIETSAWLQFDAFFSKEWLKFKKQRKLFMFTSGCLLAILYILRKATFLPFPILYMLGLGPGTSSLLAFILDRQRKMTKIYALIGVSQLSYIGAYTSFYFLKTQMTIVFVFAWFGWYSDYNGTLVTFFRSYSSFLYAWTLLSCLIISKMLFNLMISLFVKKTQFVFTINSYIGLIVNIICLTPIYKYALIGGSGPSGTPLVFQLLAFLNPQGIFTLAYQASFGSGLTRPTMSKQLNWTLLGAFFVQIAVLLVIIWYRVTYCSNDFALKTTFLKTSRNLKSGGSDFPEQGRNQFNSSLTTELLEKVDVDPIKLEIKNLTKKFGNFTAVDNLSFELASNTISCILGHNGAGKTTLINTICGVSQATSGEVILDRVNIFEHPEALVGNIGYCTGEDIGLMTTKVSEYLNFIACLKGVRDPADHVGRVMKKVGLTKFARFNGKQLSGGTRRRLNIAAALIGNPKILMMDEPSSGLDPKNRRALWKVLKKLKSEERIVLLTTHYLEEAEELSDDVIIMDKGKIDLRGSVEEIVHEYGIGYRLILEGVRTEQLKDSVIEGVLETTALKIEELSVDDTGLATAGKLSFVLPLASRRRIGDILRMLQDLGVQYSIENNTLEEAFINIGKNKDENGNNAEEQKRREETYQRLMSTTYEPSTLKIWKALVSRKVQLFFTSSLDIATYFYFVVIPGLLTYFRSRESVMNLTLLLTFSMYAVLEGLYATTIYVRLPFNERKSRMRYYLKMAGVGSAMYYGHLFMIDVLFVIIMNVLAYSFLFLMYLGKINLDQKAGMNFLFMVRIVIYVSLIGFGGTCQCKFMKNLTALILVSF